MRAGTLVVARLIRTATAPEERRKNLLPEAEEYRGELMAPLQVGTRLCVGDGLITSPVEMIDPVGPTTFHVKTQNSLYEVTLLPNF